MFIDKFCQLLVRIRDRIVLVLKPLFKTLSVVTTSRVSHMIDSVSHMAIKKSTPPKAPEDFKLIDGPDRIVCWLRDGNEEFAEIFHERVTKRDLVRLAEWMLDVAAYLEIVNPTPHTDKGAKK